MKGVLLIILGAGIQLACAQAPGFLALKNPAQFEAAFGEASRQLLSVQSDFSQVKSLSMLKDKVSSSGRFYYQQKNKVRIEYIKPFQYLMILNDGQMLMKDEQKQSTFNTHSNKILQSVNNILIDCLSGNVYRNREFKTSVFESNKEYQLWMLPQSSFMKKMFNRIEVFVSKSNYSIQKLVMTEINGDQTQMVFSNQVLNKTLDSQLFKTR
ncbi:MAG TPA: outer membrane lipoprotein carrier protein LolA [Chitinophagaceae bacterium]|nr:outer membrane lipoprotein carrier protein LolA [Chitinophagaceae bacterium]